MTTTPDVTALRRALSVTPGDTNARLVYADALQDAGDERGAILQRIVAQPDDDIHRENLAAWWEANGDPERAEFVRVQVELAKELRDIPERHHNNLDMILDPQSSGDQEWKHRVWDLQARERELLAANEARWRAAGKCEACNGTGMEVTEANPEPCEHCQATGDSGGLLRRFNFDPAHPPAGNSLMAPVHFRRGVIERMDCTLSECGSVEQVTCPGCDGYAPSACIACRGAGTVPRWVPSPWARAVLRSHATVRELWVTDRVPLPDVSITLGIANTFDWLSVVIPDLLGSEAAFVPQPVFDVMKARRPRNVTPATGGGEAIENSTESEARAALAVALATLTRAAVEGES